MISMPLKEYCLKSGQQERTMQRKCQRGSVNARKISGEWHLFLVPAEMSSADGVIDYDYEEEYASDESEVKEELYGEIDASSGDACACDSACADVCFSAGAEIEVPVRVKLILSVEVA